jgi:hypothetical protein
MNFTVHNLIFIIVLFHTPSIHPSSKAKQLITKTSCSLRIDTSPTTVGTYSPDNFPPSNFTHNLARKNFPKHFSKNNYLHTKKLANAFCYDSSKKAKGIAQIKFTISPSSFSSIDSDQSLFSNLKNNNEES